MKLEFGKDRRERGSVLLITLMLCGILGMTLGGYLYWARTQNLLVAQSQMWNTAMSYAEAGIEEGMSQLNASFGTNFMPSIATNWPSPVAGIYGPRTNSFANGSYSVLIVTTNQYPTVIATGYALLPYIGRQVARSIVVTTTNQYAFSVAIASQQDITLNGNNISVDGYDSGDPSHSTNGLYNAATRLANGDVASMAGLISVNNADINGKLYLGPTASYTIGSQGFVGDLNWTGPGMETGWWGSDFNQDFKPVQLPDTTGFIAPGPAGTNVYSLSNGGYYINGDFSLKNSDTMLVSGNATLYVSGNISMSSQSAIIIAPGAQLKIYAAGPTASFSSVNTSGNAFSFQYYGLPSNKSLSWSGNSAYVGMIYAASPTHLRRRREHSLQLPGFLRCEFRQNERPFQLSLR